MNKNIETSVIVPCLNEEAGLPQCLSEIKSAIRSGKFSAEVIVVDNGSTDKSAAIVRATMRDFPELKLIEEPDRGYGNALRAGIRAAQGRCIFMADCDCSYEWKDIPRFIAALQNGTDLVLGNRFAGEMEKQAMPLHHKYIGNPALSLIVKIFFKVSIGDIHCGARAISRKAVDRLHLHAGGMEFASEMVMKAAREGLVITEIPVHYRARVGTSKLRSFRDGWRHLRFILLYSPLYFFFLPGAALFGIGLVAITVLYFSTPSLFGIQLFVHPMFLASAMMILGYELVFFAFFAKIYAMTHLGESNAAIEKLFRFVTIERVGIVGLFLFIFAALIYGSIFTEWLRSGFSSLDQIKNSVVALTLLILGAQTFFSAFMLSIVSIKGK